MARLRARNVVLMCISLQCALGCYLRIFDKMGISARASETRLVASRFAIYSSRKRHSQTEVLSSLNVTLGSLRRVRLISHRMFWFRCVILRPSPEISADCADFFEIVLAIRKTPT